MDKSAAPFPRAVLFDFDGVIADSGHVHHTAWGAAFEEIFDQPMGPFPNAILAGKAPSLIAAHLAGEIGGRPEHGPTLYDRKLALLLEGKEPPALLPGIRPLMNWLTERSIPFGIASNAPGPFVRRSVAQLDLPVEIVLGVEDFEAPKPAPAPYWQLAEQLDLPVEWRPRTWILEDSLTGMQAAVASGMYTLGIATQYTARELTAQGAHRVYDTPEGVYQLATQLTPR